LKRQILDMHCDTPFEMYQQKQLLKHNALHLDLDRMEEYDGYIQVFAAFVDRKNICVSPMNHCLSLLRKTHEELNKNKDCITLIQNLHDLNRVSQRNGMGAILSIEGGEALEGNLSALWMYYQLGVRLITLTWNWSNEIADGILEPRGGGLTEFGKDAVIMMEKMGILIDVSHLSEQGFWDVAKYTTRPFVASHSCVKQLCPHPRNLSDAQISCLIQRRGGVGINFFPEFLATHTQCSVDDVIKHMEYILSLGGEDILGIGSDFDGVSSLPKDMHGVQDIKGLISSMTDHGFSNSLIEKILFRNFHRIWSEILLSDC